MFARDAQRIRTDGDLDAALENVHTGAAVFVVHLRGGEPYLGRTGVLRRRLKRLLRQSERSGPFNLRERAQSIEFWPAGSRLESSLVLYLLARQLYPDRYLKFLKLHMPVYVRLSLGERFPRTSITSRPFERGIAYGPFRSRAAAEQFEHACLELFQLRRCPEELQPSPDHPGCMYGEMNMCLRPCQAVVSIEEYASEAHRVRDFLSSGGKHALAAAKAARDRLSADLEFEAAAREHRRLEKIEQTLSFRDTLVSMADTAAGIAVAPSPIPGECTLFPMQGGCWQAPISLALQGAEGESLDTRVKRAWQEQPEPVVDTNARPEHLALLARWGYSSYCDGVWIGIEDFSRIPWRKIVGAISRTVHHSGSAASH